MQSRLGLLSRQSSAQRPLSRSRSRRSQLTRRKRRLPARHPRSQELPSSGQPPPVARDRRRRRVVMPPGRGRVLATIHSAQPRPVWARHRGLRRLAAPRHRAHLLKVAAPRQLPRGLEARAPAADRVRATHGLAARVQAGRGPHPAACRLGPRVAAAALHPAADLADRVAADTGRAARAPGLGLGAAAQAADPAVRAVVAAELAAPGQEWRHPGLAQAVVVAAARPVPSAGQAGSRPVAASPRSSGVKSSTTCRRQRSVACRSRAETVR